MKTSEGEDSPSLSQKKAFVKLITDYFSRPSSLTKKIKGFLKNPSFCLKIAALFLFLVLMPGLIIRVSSGKNDFCLIDISKTFVQPGNELFIGPSSSFLPESPQFILVGTASLKSSSPPVVFSPQVLGSLVAGAEPEEELRNTIIEHIVGPGETLSFLAAEYGISLETILWANDLNKNSVIRPGNKLVILPVSGTVHHVKSGDTISGIAKTYKAETREIIAFNQLSGEADIYIGDIIIVSGGVMPAPSVQKQSAPASAPLASSYFIAPVSSPYIITQGLHWYNAIDFSHKGNACGKPVFAAAGGTVQRVVYGRTGYGNYVTISHPNGVVTLYAHLSHISVSSKQPVSQGTIIGLIGNTGYTIGPTGCHVHFEVRGARNPFAR